MELHKKLKYCVTSANVVYKFLSNKNIYNNSGFEDLTNAFKIYCN